ncbi:MAG: TetR/AcrR family transcriptional regulator [Thermoplasmatota archaeon]
MSESDRTKKEELIDAAERLFHKDGYSDTSIDDICDEVGVAHGLFYYYFDTKEEIIEAITERMIDELEERLSEITHKDHLRADEKFIRFMTTAFQRKKDKAYLVSYFSEDKEPKLYQRLFYKTVELTVPYLREIVEQGIEEEIFDTEYPEETMRFWFYGRLFLMDVDRFVGREFLKDIKAEAYMLERLLGAETPFMTEFYERYGDEIIDFIDEAEGDG